LTGALIQVELEKLLRTDKIGNNAEIAS